MPTVTLRESAKLDLIDHFVYLAEHAGEDVADRFLTNAETSFNDLAMQAQIGARLPLKNPALENVRKWRVKGFDNHLVFYEPHDDGVSIVRVLHASSDWWGLLGFAV
jgi:toxin ParE1/3/4